MSALKDTRVCAGRVCTAFPADALPTLPFGEFAGTYDAGDGVLLCARFAVTPEDLPAFDRLMETNGWEKIRRESIGICEFESFRKNGLCAEVFFHPARGELRIAGIPYDPYSTHDCFRKHAVSPVCGATLTQVGLNYERVINGMSYILRTPAGSFILIDGGMGGQGEAEKLRSLLYTANGGKRPTVAAWILTHPHNDHMEAAGEFAERYAQDVDLKRMIFNFVSDADLEAGNDWTPKASARIDAALRGAWSRTEVIKPRTGNHLFLDGFEMQILHCQEEWFPKYPVDHARSNANTLCFSLELCGRKILFTGDMAQGYMKHIGEWYGDAIRCDVLQVVHHGRTHGYIPTYEKMSPEICLWPASLKSVEQYGSQPFNQWLMEHVNRHYFCHEGTVTLSLPELNVIPFPEI